MSDPAFDIAASGMAAERTAMDVIASNLASGGAAGRSVGIASAEAEAARDTAFVPASFSSALDDALSTGGLSDIEMPFDGGMPWMAPFVEAAAPAGAGDDSSAPPAAGGSAGDPIGQMIALVATGRAYDADVAALQAAKQMDLEASDIDKF